MKATNIPRKSPGIEKKKLLIVIMAIRCLFIKPRARSIPYSYVLPSTSASMRDKTSIDARIAKKRITVTKVAERKSWMMAVVLNYL